MGEMWLWATVNEQFVERVDGLRDISLRQYCVFGGCGGEMRLGLSCWEQLTIDVLAIRVENPYSQSVSKQNLSCPARSHTLSRRMMPSVVFVLRLVLHLSAGDPRVRPHQILGRNPAAAHVCLPPRSFVFLKFPFSQEPNRAKVESEDRWYGGVHAEVAGGAQDCAVTAQCGDHVDLVGETRGIAGVDGEVERLVDHRCNSRLENQVEAGVCAIQMLRKIDRRTQYLRGPQLWHEEDVSWWRWPVQ